MKRREFLKKIGIASIIPFLYLLKSSKSKADPLIFHPDNQPNDSVASVHSFKTKDGRVRQWAGGVKFGEDIEKNKENMEALGKVDMRTLERTKPDCEEKITTGKMYKFMGWK